MNPFNLVIKTSISLADWSKRKKERTKKEINKKKKKKENRGGGGGKEKGNGGKKAISRNKQRVRLFLQVVRLGKHLKFGFILQSQSGDIALFVRFAACLYQLYNICCSSAPPSSSLLQIATLLVTSILLAPLIIFPMKSSSHPVQNWQKYTTPQYLLCRHSFLIFLFLSAFVMHSASG